MSLISLQVAAALIIFTLSLLAGLLPSRLMQRHHTWFALGDAWASGIFLGAAFFHMLPDADTDFAQALPQQNYPFAALLVMAGFLLLLIIERTVVRITTPEQSSDSSYVTSLLLFILLSIHSVLEGTALGINTTLGSAFIIFLAIIAHKGSASFALAINLLRSGLSKTATHIFILLFSVMTPLGIAIASITQHILRFKSAFLATGIFNALAAGTFLYIGMRHILEERFTEYQHINEVKEFIAVVFGIALMAILAIWL